MATPTLFNRNIVKLSEEAIERLLEPIPPEILVEKVAAIKGWQRKRVPLAEGQSKAAYFNEHIGTSITLSMLRELRTLREHMQIAAFKWRIFSWDRSIARYFPDKIEPKLEEEILQQKETVSLDAFVVDEESKIVFILLEQWEKQTVADTFLSVVETNVPEYFRAYLFISRKKLLVQEKTENATKAFTKLFEKTFKVSVEEEKINAMIIRKFVKESKENVKRLVIRVPQEVGGFGGLSELTFMGPDVLAGARGLRTRHETSPIDVGPWTGVSSTKIALDAGKAISIATIQEALWLFELMKKL